MPSPPATSVARPQTCSHSPLPPAASLGTLDADGGGFGAGYPHAVVFSMQATKPFSVAEGAVVHSGDAALIERIRAMANFGFERPRSASLPGLNAKLPEVLAAIASAKLDEIEEVSERRAAIEAVYRESLDEIIGSGDRVACVLAVGR